MCKSEHNRSVLANEGTVDLLTRVIADKEERPLASELAASALYSLSFDENAFEAKLDKIVDEVVEDVMKAAEGSVTHVFFLSPRVFSMLTC